MDLDYFKDWLFDLINECDTLDITDIEADDRNNSIFVTVAGGRTFRILCSEAGDSVFRQTTAQAVPPAL